MQTSYPKTMPRAFAGMKANATGDTVRSFVNAEASAEIPFGVAVIQGSADNRAVLPNAAGDAAKFVGVVVHSHDYSKPTQLGDTGIKPKHMMSVMDSGDLYVIPEEAVVRGDRAFVRIANGVADVTKVQKGAFRKSADTATAIELKGVTYLESAAAGVPVLIRISAPATRAAV